jgi:hypothetical protein
MRLLKPHIRSPLVASEVSRERIVFAFLVAPGVVPLGLYVHAWTSLTHDQFDRVAITYSLMFVVSYVLAVVVGIPMHRFMQTYQHHLLRHYVLAGALIGAIPGFGLFLSGLPNMSLGILLPLLTGAAAGAFSAMLFWLIGIRTSAAKPDKTMEPTR